MLRIDFRKLPGLYGEFAVVLLNTFLLLLCVEAASLAIESRRPGSAAAAPLGFEYAPYRMMKQSDKQFIPGVRLNRDGFRTEPLQTLQGDAESYFTIVFIGGSVCVGFGGNTGPPLTALLENQLRQAGLRQLRILNLCQGGAVTAQELAIFIQYGLSLRPKVVVSFNGANDFMSTYPLGLNQEPNLPFRDREMRGLWERANRSFVVQGLQGTATWRLVSRFRDRLDRNRRMADLRAGKGVSVNDTLTSYLLALDIVNRIATSYGIRHVILLQPFAVINKPLTGTELAHLAEEGCDGNTLPFCQTRIRASVDLAVAELNKLAAQTGAKVFDLTRVFEQRSESIYLDNMHFDSPLGYSLILEHLTKNGFLDWITGAYHEWESQGRLQPGSRPPSAGR